MFHGQRDRMLDPRSEVRVPLDAKASDEANHQLIAFVGERIAVPHVEIDHSHGNIKRPRKSNERVGCAKYIIVTEKLMTDGVSLHLFRDVLVGEDVLYERR